VVFLFVWFFPEKTEVPVFPRKKSGIPPKRYTAGRYTMVGVDLPRKVGQRRLRNQLRHPPSLPPHGSKVIVHSGDEYDAALLPHVTNIPVHGGNILWRVRTPMGRSGCNSVAGLYPTRNSRVSNACFNICDLALRATPLASKQLPMWLKMPDVIASTIRMAPNMAHGN
jgi:hypothetical protein